MQLGDVTPQRTSRPCYLWSGVQRVNELPRDPEEMERPLCRASRGGQGCRAERQQGPNCLGPSQGGKRVVERPEHGGYGGVVQSAGTQLSNNLYLAEARQVVTSWKRVSIRSLARPINTWESFFTLTPRYSPGTSPPSLTRSLSCRLNLGKDKDTRGLKPDRGTDVSKEGPSAQ